MVKSKVLPPLVNGKVNGYLSVSVDEIFWVRKSQEDVVVELHWWGDKDNCVFKPIEIGRPLNSQNQEDVSITFDIRTSPGLFEAYLSNCEKLTFHVYKAGSREHLGKAVVRDLDRVITNKTFQSYFPILNAVGSRLGDLHIGFNLWLNRKSHELKEKLPQEQPTKKPALKQPTEKKPVGGSIPLENRKIPSKDSNNDAKGRSISQALSMSKELRNAMVKSVLDDWPGEAIDSVVTESARAKISARKDVKLVDFLLGKELTPQEEALAVETLRCISPNKEVLELASAPQPLQHDKQDLNCCIHGKVVRETRFVSSVKQTTNNANSWSSSYDDSEKVDIEDTSATPEQIMNNANCYRLTIGTMTLTTIGLQKINYGLMSKKDHITPGVIFGFEFSEPSENMTVPQRLWNTKIIKKTTKKIKKIDVIWDETWVGTLPCPGGWSRLLSLLTGKNSINPVASGGFSLKVSWRWTSGGHRLPCHLGTAALPSDQLKPRGPNLRLTLPVKTNIGITAGHISIKIELGKDKLIFGYALLGVEEEAKGTDDSEQEKVKESSSGEGEGNRSEIRVQRPHTNCVSCGGNVDPLPKIQHHPAVTTTTSTSEERYTNLDCGPSFRAQHLTDEIETKRKPKGTSTSTGESTRRVPSPDKYKGHRTVLEPCPCVGCSNDRIRRKEMELETVDKGRQERGEGRLLGGTGGFPEQPENLAESRRFETETSRSNTNAYHERHFSGLKSGHSSVRDPNPSKRMDMNHKERETGYRGSTRPKELELYDSHRATVHPKRLEHCENWTEKIGTDTRNDLHFMSPSTLIRGDKSARSHRDFYEKDITSHTDLHGIPNPLRLREDRFDNMLSSRPSHREYISDRNELRYDHYSETENLGSYRDNFHGNTIQDKRNIGNYNTHGVESHRSTTLSNDYSSEFHYRRDKALKGCQFTERNTRKPILTRKGDPYVEKSHSVEYISTDLGRSNFADCGKFPRERDINKDRNYLEDIDEGLEYNRRIIHTSDNFQYDSPSLDKEVNEIWSCSNRQPTGSVRHCKDLGKPPIHPNRTGARPKDLGNKTVCHEFTLSVDKVSGFPFFSNSEAKDMDYYVDYSFPDVDSSGVVKVGGTHWTTEVGSLMDRALHLSRVHQHCLTMYGDRTLALTLQHVDGIRLNLWGRSYNNGPSDDTNLATAFLPMGRLFTMERQFQELGKRTTRREKLYLPLVASPYLNDKVIKPYENEAGELQLSLTYKSFEKLDSVVGASYLLSGLRNCEQSKITEYEERIIPENSPDQEKKNFQGFCRLNSSSEDPCGMRDVIYNPVQREEVSSEQPTFLPDRDLQVCYDLRGEDDQDLIDFEAHSQASLLLNNEHNSNLTTQTQIKVYTVQSSVKDSQQPTSDKSSFTQNGEAPQPSNSPPQLNSANDTLHSVSPMSSEKEEARPNQQQEIDNKSTQTSIRILTVDRGCNTECKCSKEEATTRSAEGEQKMFKVRVEVDRVFNLPLVPTKDGSLAKPTSQVNFTAFDDEGEKEFTTKTVADDTNPVWATTWEVKLPVKHLQKVEFPLLFQLRLLQLEHCQNQFTTALNTMEHHRSFSSTYPKKGCDLISAKLDLTVLSAGLPILSGWFPLVSSDFAANHGCGQIKISVTPLEDITPYREGWLKEYTKTRNLTEVKNSGIRLPQGIYSPGLLDDSLSRGSTSSLRPREELFCLTKYPKQRFDSSLDSKGSRPTDLMTETDHESLAVSLKEKLAELDNVTEKMRNWMIGQRDPLNTSDLRIDDMSSSIEEAEKRKRWELERNRREEEQQRSAGEVEIERAMLEEVGTSTHFDPELFRRLLSNFEPSPPDSLCLDHNDRRLSGETEFSSGGGRDSLIVVDGRREPEGGSLPDKRPSINSTTNQVSNEANGSDRKTSLEKASEEIERIVRAFRTKLVNS